MSMIIMITNRKMIKPSWIFHLTLNNKNLNR
jgi:hypothetical protein